ncbi:MAG: C39 family peptidase [Planctomycetes bacterium]|nr:C39 family peptidase [Planctomycetota bacterium]
MVLDDDTATEDLLPLEMLPDPFADSIDASADNGTTGTGTDGVAGSAPGTGAMQKSPLSCGAAAAANAIETDIEDQRAMRDRFDEELQKPELAGPGYGTDVDCNRGHLIDAAKAISGGDWSARDFNRGALRSAIDNGQRIIFIQEGRNGRGHAVTVTGYERANPNTFVYIDPRTGTQRRGGLGFTTPTTTARVVVPSGGAPN